MSIKFRCFQCEKVLETEESRAGKTGKCPHCGVQIKVPTLSEKRKTKERDPWDDSPEPQSSSSSWEEREQKRKRKGMTCEVCGAFHERKRRKCRSCGEPMEERKRKPGKYDVSIMKALTDTRNIFNTEMGISVGAVVLPVFLLAVVYFVGAIVLTFLMAIIFSALGPVGTLVLLGGSFVFLFLMLTLFCYLFGGTFLVLNKTVRGKKTDLGDLLSAGRFFLRFLGSFFLVYTAIGITVFVAIYFLEMVESFAGPNDELFGFLMLLTILLIGLLFLLVFWPLPYFIVDCDEKGIQPILSCFSCLKHHWVASIVAIGIVVLALVSGTLFLGLGLLVTIPFCFLMFAVMFCHMTGRRIAIRLQ